jgi:hypothetical protein
MSKFFLCFSGGAGGNWLSYLTYLLENNKQFAQRKRLNFHKSYNTSQFYLSHYPQIKDNNLKDDNSTLLPKVYFNSYCAFNFYINYVKKLKLIDKSNLNDEIILKRKISELTHYAVGAIYFSRYQVDLDYKFLYTDPEKFMVNYYNILKTHNIEFIPNNDTVLLSIQEFKETCVNPIDVYENFNDIIWLGWCLAIIHLTNSYNYFDNRFKNIDEVNNFLNPKKQKIMKLSSNLVLFYG